MLREYDCPSCGYRIDSLAGMYQCPRCKAVLPSHEPETGWSTEKSSSVLRPEEMLQPHSDPNLAGLYQGQDETVRRETGSWLVWLGAFAMVLVLSTVAWGFLDLDRDGLPAWQELQDHTNPFRSDTDHDGLPDGWETARGLNPRSNDTDHDGLLDRAEITAGFDPRYADTDHNGISDNLDTPPSAPHCDGPADLNDARCDLQNPPTPHVSQTGLLLFVAVAILVAVVAATAATVWWRQPTPEA